MLRTGASSTLLGSDWPRRATLSAAGLLIGGAVVAPGLGTPGIGLDLLLLAATIVAIAALSERLFIVIVLGSLFLDTFRLELYGGLFGLRPSFIVLGLGLPFVAFRGIKNSERAQSITLPVLVSLLVVAFLVATVANPGSGYQTRGLASTALLLLNVTVFMFVLQFCRNHPGQRELVFNALVFFGTCYALIAVLSVVGSSLGVKAAQDMVVLRPAGEYVMTSDQTLTPRALLLDTVSASYLGAIAVLALLRSLTTQSKHRALYGLASLVLLGAVLLSFTRGAWLGAISGAAAAIALLSLGTGKGNVGRRILATIVCGAAVVTLSVQMVPSLTGVVSGRAANLLNTTQGTGQQRLDFWVTIAVDAMASPIIGHGADAYKALLPPPCPPPCGEYVAENASVEIFHATGIIGLGLYLLALLISAKVLWGGIRAARAKSGTAPFAIPAVAAFVATVVSAQFNPSFWGNAYWVIWALVLALAESAQVAVDNDVGDIHRDHALGQAAYA